MIGVAFIPFAIIFFIQLILAIFVYNDSQKRGMNSMLWVLITVLLPNFIGFIVYLVVRGQAGTQLGEKLKDLQSHQWEQNNRPEDRVDTRSEDIIDSRKKSESKQYYSTKTPKGGGTRCQTCGRIISGYPNKCPYCEAPVHNEMHEDDDLMRANAARKGIIAVVAVFLAIGMLAFALISLTPFRHMEISEVIDTFKYDIFNGEDKNASSIISSKYSYWDGTKEKIIEADKDGVLDIEFEMESKEGILFAVIKDSDNYIMYNIPGNIHEHIEINVKRGETYYISIVGQETKGFYKFEWSIK
jgi:hypothetical protein